VTCSDNCRCILKILFLICEQLRSLQYETLRLTPIECLPLHPIQIYTTLLQFWQTVAEAARSLSLILAETSVVFLPLHVLARIVFTFTYTRTSSWCLHRCMLRLKMRRIAGWSIQFDCLIRTEVVFAATSRRVQRTTEPSIQVVMGACSG
jgi:hypothetical protein